MIVVKTYRAIGQSSYSLWTSFKDFYQNSEKIWKTSGMHEYIDLEIISVSDSSTENVIGFLLPEEEDKWNTLPEILNPCKIELRKYPVDPESDPKGFFEYGHKYCVRINQIENDFVVEYENFFFSSIKESLYFVKQQKELILG